MIGKPRSSLSEALPFLCGFMVRSHDEAELTSIVKEHAKKVHNMDMTEAQIKSMMKTEKMEKKKAEKMEKKM